MRNIAQLLCLMMLATTFVTFADVQVPNSQGSVNLMDELDPFDPATDQLLQEYDRIYEEGTGLPAHIDQGFNFESIVPELAPTCVRDSCEVWVQVVKSTQVMHFYLRGRLTANWKVSTGIRGRATPNFDKNPNGRIYDSYTSTKFPGGDYRGLGNMPYAVFIRDGFAIHGTGEVNWPKLGQPASHGCIRLHPDHAFYFNRLVRQNGVKNVWITVQE